MKDRDEIISPFRRKVLERHGINDDQVTSLLIVERYQRHPEPNNSIVKLMLSAIDADLPLEAQIVRREVELGRALMMEKSNKKLWGFSLSLEGTRLRVRLI